MVQRTPVAPALAVLLLAAACVPQGVPPIAIAAPVAPDSPVAVAPVLPPLPALAVVDDPGKADAGIAAASRRLETYCTSLQVAALGASLFGKEKKRRAAAAAARILNTVCTHPPRDVESALAVAAQAYEAIREQRGGF